MVKLEKKRDIMGVVAMSLAPIVAIIPIIALAPRIEVILLVLAAYAGLLYYSLTNGLKPAAWIDNNTLYIRSGMMSADKIPKEAIETMRYETNHSVDRPKIGPVEAHILFVDMKGYQEWPITIYDQIEHLDQLRLYNFIKDNFWPLSEPIKANA